MSKLSDLYDASDAIALAERIDRGEVSAGEVLDTAIALCEERNPEINAVVTTMFEEARSQLDECPVDAPFYGVPFLLKDLGLLYRGVATTRGSRFFAGDVPDHDSELTRRYKRAGLIIFGKSASPEFGITTTTESALHGATRNPWRLERTSGGSSGGAAAAVAAGIVPAAHASDGGGSIRIPASCCGLVGLKPSRGRMPFGPDAGEGWGGLGTSHVVCRSVRDSAALLDVTHGPDLGAPYAAPAAPESFLAETKREPGRLRIALQTRAFNDAPVAPDCIAAATDAATLCSDLGHEVEEVDFTFDSAELGLTAQTIIGCHLRAEIEEGEKRFGRAFGAEDLEPFTKLMLAGAADRKGEDYIRAIAVVHRTGREVEHFLQGYDVILSPTMGCPPKPIGELSLSNPDIAGLAGAMVETSGFTQLFNLTGQPAVSLPLYWNEEGLPIGVQLAACFGAEALLFRVAAQLESARPWSDRRPASVSRLAVSPFSG